ncbi:type 2 isopentenyl-diphosphate Delta-isomerase [Pyrofollis japonicus]|uniref:type 2 isopentenyl-diphosphate Delta-isomerase n=1 Tax=Pyrofollis japonicus TaxID=3060460 RepID=UPI00295B9B74|nr:type 2 isopentenyl-diphosphate Delta-isomerase [Pyrofollis japonicus]BEP18512.1 type 2 isopentenyl-diphosphate Delta-isomerase [Pyrofollis japonicus]
MGLTPLRKLDHIRIVLDNDVEHKSKSTLFEEVELLHNALPEIDMNDVRTDVQFLGYRLSAPLMITGMTGGHDVAAEINCAIAEAAEELGLAMGVGSQRAAIEHPELAYTFSIARKCGPHIPLIANIGAPQLAKGYSVSELRKAIEMIDADAIAIHLNAGQEAFQPEGDVNYQGVIEKLAEAVDSLGKPLIIKETGQGLNYDVVYSLRTIGIRFFDVSGAGGTSWIKVEMHRAQIKNERVLAEAASTFADWGVSTAQAVIEARWAAPDACIIASGGIRSGLDAAKAVAIGADIAGIALPVIRSYSVGGSDAIKALIKRFITEIRAALFLTGSNNIASLRKKPVILGPRLLEILRERGVDRELYFEATRILTEPGEKCA